MFNLASLIISANILSVAVISLTPNPKAETLIDSVIKGWSAVLGRHIGQTVELDI